MPNDYCPVSLVYDPTFKQDCLPCCSPKDKLALDPDYYPQNYVPHEEEQETPLLIDNLVNPPEMPQKEKRGRRMKERRQKMRKKKMAEKTQQRHRQTGDNR